MLTTRTAAELVAKAREEADGDVMPDAWSDLGDAGREAAEAMEPVLREVIEALTAHAMTT